MELAPHLASRFDYTNDTVHFDMILVMDKFTAADVMREVWTPFTFGHSVMCLGPAFMTPWKYRIISRFQHPVSQEMRFEYLKTPCRPTANNGCFFCLQISVFDTINKDGKYAQKVRRLGEFHLTLREGTGTDGQDIEDPLYGNTGGTVEMVRHQDCRRNE